MIFAMTLKTVQHPQIESLMTTIVLVQFSMAESIQENLSRMRSILLEKTEPGALVLFPECALTGFHKGLKEITVRETIQEAQASLQALCDQRNQSLVIGCPWFPKESQDIWNAALVLKAGEKPQVAAKIGLTASERSFFTPGTERPVFSWRGKRFSILFCREILDDLNPGLDLQDDLDFLLWPGYIAWSDDPENYREAARDLAKHHGCPIYQCNWPNSLNNPNQRGMGGSLVISSDGRILLQGPFDTAQCLTVPFPPEA